MTRFRGAARIYRNHAVAIDHMLMAAAVAIMLRTSWRAWGSVFVDFPEELYVPWRLAEGLTLYRDVFHLYGPLSQYYHALLFKLFGVSYSSVILANILIVLVFTAVTYRLFSFFLHPPWSVLAAFMILLAFPFNHVTSLGTYNYMSPYSHEAVHGMLCVLGMVVLYLSYSRERSEWKILLVGLLAGLTFVFKPEPVLAGLPVLGAALWDLAADAGKDRRRRILTAATTIGLASLPAAFMFFWFRLSSGSAEALKYTFGAFLPLFQTNLASHKIFQDMVGTFQLRENLLKALSQIVYFSAVVLTAWQLDRHMTLGSLFRRPRLEGVRWGLTLLLSLLALRFMDVLNASMVLSYFTSAYGLYLVFRLLREPRQWRTILPLLVLAAVALLYLARIFFRSSLYWMGFVHAVPAMALFVVIHLGFIPDRMRNAYGGGNYYRTVLAIVLGWLTLAHWQHSHEFYALKTVPVSEGRDRHYEIQAPTLSLPGAWMDDVLTRVDRSVPEDGTLLVLPEAVSVNYFLRRRNPTPFTSQFLVPHNFQSIGGTEGAVAILEDRRPDYILYLRRLEEVDDPVLRMRGEEGFAEGAFRWIEKNYDLIDVVGKETRDFNRLTYVLWKRKG